MKEMARGVLGREPFGWFRGVEGRMELGMGRGPELNEGGQGAGD
jgi:hypothetical protein